jgi:hypothetical protein
MDASSFAPSENLWRELLTLANFGCGCQQDASLIKPEDFSTQSERAAIDEPRGRQTG